MKKRTGKKSGGDYPPRQQRLRAEDELLWHKITQTLNPIDDKARNRVHMAPMQERQQKSPKSAQKPDRPDDRKFAPASLPLTPARGAQPPPVNPIEKRLNRRISKGMTGFDARIDLHGMTQAQAHSALLGFLRTSQARGCRVALVITGKGRSEVANDRFEMHESPGVLRRGIRNWLQQPEFRPYVAAYAQAHRRHGGEGAIYVQIRRDRDGRDR